MARVADGATRLCRWPGGAARVAIVQRSPRFQYPVSRGVRDRTGAAAPSWKAPDSCTPVSPLLGHLREPLWGIGAFDRPRPSLAGVHEHVGSTESDRRKRVSRSGIR